MQTRWNDENEVGNEYLCLSFEIGIVVLISLLRWCWLDFKLLK